MSYILSPSLQRAIDVAIHLNKPLLLCGEPGTGKTRLADHLAETFSKNNPFEGAAPFHPRPLIFNTKTTSVATDLFYTYDTLSRLRDAYAKADVAAGPYIKLSSLGKAIAMKHGAEALAKMDKINTIRDLASDIPAMPFSSIVLIDEIDKAPRDFPNDLLSEIDNQFFDIRELETSLYPPKTDNHAKTIVLMTSNNERNLPDAFLRRCVFHYIDFPGPDDLERIIRSHFQIPPKANVNEELGVIKTFRKLREQPLLKRPATAELIDWLRVLEKENLLEKACEPFETMPAEIRSSLMNSLGTLIKNRGDHQEAIAFIKKN
jgi:MoxR-like ATPase